MKPSASPQPRRAAAAAFIGTMIEWYDFYIYATAAALVFGQLFFPSEDKLFSTMAAFGTFAVGFFARPLGGIVFGHIGDRIGRKKSLVITLVMMGGGHRVHRLVADLRPDRRRGTGAADPASRRAGHCRRRRVGRGGVDGGRACAERSA